MRPCSRSLLCLAFCFVIALLPGRARAQRALTGSNTIHYDFADFTGAGFSATPGAGQLDSDEWVARRVNTLDLAFGATSTNMDFMNGVSTGGELDGGIWAFTPVAAACSGGTRTLLGVQPSNRTFTPGSFLLRVRNGTGAALTQVFVGYTLAHLNDSSRSVAHTFAVLQVDGAGAETGRVAVPAFATATPEAASGAGWAADCRGAMIDLSTVPIADGADLVLAFEFDDGAGSGSRDEVGITDVRVGTMPLPDAGVPPVDAGAGGDAGLDGGADTDAGAGTDAGADLDAGAAMDSGTEPVDSGVPDPRDASTEPTDGGRVDGSMDAGSDAGDSGSPAVDAGVELPRGDGGCGCAAPGSAPRWPWLPALLLGLVFVAIRRR
jgi:MYXO-CTERM domain-containing protein